ncbi:MAG: potassium-transporting ATPase subunit KdpA, partial [Candidatus Contendobacter sp.]|nr:potassium-transporting ATPase subunit KdpA [Candidatus Contendobacter sp.]
MTPHAWLLLGLYLLVLLTLVKPLGIYIANVMEGRSWALRLGGSIEAVIYRLGGVHEESTMGWLQYALALLLFNTLGVFAVYALQRLQLWLPLNPQRMANVGPDSAFNTAVSFVTNTNWQGYAGEATMSYLTQMLALTVQNFLSAATGIVVVVALIRGFARHTAQDVGNAWVDLTRVTLYVLLPLSLVFAVFLIGQGAIQNFAPYRDVTTLEVTHYDSPKLDAASQPLKDDQGNPVTEPVITQTQTLAMGPVASQEAIK